jgi:hypothetical protein
MPLSNKFFAELDFMSRKQASFFEVLFDKNPTED